MSLFALFFNVYTAVASLGLGLVFVDKNITSGYYK